jgi:glyoxylate utilization-related uncharacterized protein
MKTGWSLKRIFLKNKIHFKAPASRRLSPSRKLPPFIEMLEDRCLLSQGAFLQGFAFVDSNHNGHFDTGEGIANATIRLSAADSATLSNYPGSTLSTVLGSATSGSTGYYILNDGSITVPNLHGLAAGNYFLVETPPAGFTNAGTDILSQLDPASQVNASTIRVTLEDPMHLVDHFDGNGPGNPDSPSLDGNPKPGFTGQLNIHLTDSAPPPGLTTPEFFSLCMDLTQTVAGGAAFPVLPTPVGTAFTNGGEIAYLYDHYGLTALDNTHAEALQQAVWELIYGSRFTPDLSHPGVAADYNFYLSDAAGKNEAAILLDATLGGMPNTPAPGRGQSMIVTGMLNFSNVAHASPTITTTPGGTVVIGSGAKLTDSAMLSGGFNPTGTITFTLTSPSNTVVDTETVTVSGNGTYNTPNGYLPTATGTYQWVATYSGDSNNNGATSPFGSEPEVVSPASPAINTTPGGTVVIGSDAKLTDSAMLSGGFNPTGTITFTLTSPSNTVVDTETVTVSGNGTYNTPNGYLPLATGTYQWVATYSGDSNNNGATSPFGSEPEVVSPASPAINTTPGGTVVIGSGAKLTDSAMLSGGFNPTGTITFTLTSPSNTVVDTETVTVSGNGTYNTPNGYLPLATGTYQWVATYSGDSNNHGATSPLGSEPEIVSPASPAINTTPGGTVTLGSGAKLTDSATLSGGFNPTGTITFNLYNPSNVVVYTDTVTVNGNGTYTTSMGNNQGGYLPTVTGTFQWVVAYSGDSKNNGATSPFGSEPEIVSPASPAINTTPGGTVVIGSGAKLTDSAMLSGGFNPTGTITFTLYNPSNAVVYTDTVTVNGNGTYTTSTGTNPGGYLPTVTGTFQWVVTYSGDIKNNGATSPFGAEPETVNPASPGRGTTATIGFWHNQNGQALINSFGTTSGGLTLANWLARTFPNLYGVNAGSHNLTNKSNAYVAQFFLTLFNVTGQKADAQVLATALAVFTTTSSLNTGSNSQSLARGFGFIISSAGTGAALDTVSPADGAAFGLSTTMPTTTTVLDLLNRTNARAVNGVLNGGNQTLINETNDVFDGINSSGDIG